MYKHILVLAFCFASMHAGESDARDLKRAEKAYNAEISKLTKKIEKMDIAIELKFVRSMLGFTLFAIILKYSAYMPNTWLGYSGVALLAALNTFSFSTGLTAGAEGYALLDSKKELEAERTRLENPCIEQSVNVLSS